VEIAACTFSDYFEAITPIHLKPPTPSKAEHRSKVSEKKDQSQRMPTPQFFKLSDSQNQKVSDSD
jgi:hypothetical protein